ncbi:MAG: hypothetical protein MI867_04365 [Pseudomonadales bacterium]|nr:hypothetical protein [Pseudomonadales bacterium]
MLGLIGAALLALNMEFSGYGRYAFLASNITWIAYGIRAATFSLLVMQVSFTLKSLLGLYRWIVVPT